MDIINQQQIIKNRVVEPTPPASPPSSSSSPSHEFSFTISLHSNSTQVPSDTPSSFAIDLTPADDIFFHGHLLPLHLLSHLPVSPRSSTNSTDSFTLPIKDDNHNIHNHSKHTSNSDSNIIINTNRNNNQNYENSTKGRAKSKSFSIFGFSRRKKGIEDSEQEEKKKQKKRVRFDVIKKYMRMVRPFLFRRRESDNNVVGYSSSSSSYSGNLSFRNKQEVVMMRGKRGEFSAPASIRTSPTNSGLLFPSSTSTDSTMEELQAAIQAAIAHCKNSIAVEDKLKCSI